MRNPQKKWKFFVPTYGPFPRGRSHILPLLSFLVPSIIHFLLLLCIIPECSLQCPLSPLPSLSLSLCLSLSLSLSLSLCLSQTYPCPGIQCPSWSTSILQRTSARAIHFWFKYWLILTKLTLALAYNAPPDRLRCCSGPVPEPYTFDLNND